MSDYLREKIVQIKGLGLEKRLEDSVIEKLVLREVSGIREHTLAPRPRPPMRACDTCKGAHAVGEECPCKSHWKDAA